MTSGRGAPTNLPESNVDQPTRRPLNLSFVVDQGPSFPFSADVLLSSIFANTSIPASCVVAQFVDGAHPDFRRSLEDRGIRTTTIERFLDGTYCNKLRQLSFFVGRGVDVIALDTDMYVVSDPADLIADRAAICGKPVDHANPALDSLRAIWEAAGLQQPELVRSDADVRGGRTFPGNFNGGLYYVPADFVAQIDEAWRRWGSWLYARRAELLGDADQIFVEQVSFALAVAEGGHPVVSGPTNLNYPMLIPEQPRLFRSDLPIGVIHHHGFLPLARLRRPEHVNRALTAALGEAQNAIEETDSPFRARSNAAAHGAVERVELGSELLAALTADGTPKRLALHVGTPKTGTTAIQAGFVDHRADLLQHGLDYPDDVDPQHPERHQWLVTHLLNDDVGPLESRLARLWRSSPAPRVLLSAEGLTNHWADFSPRMKGWLRALAEAVPTDVYVYFRPQAAYLRSFHAQSLRNLPHPRYPYGVKDSVSEFAQRPWVMTHLDYLGLVESMRSVYGADRVHVAAYRRDIVPDFLARLGLPADLVPAGTQRVNASLSPLAVYVGRQVVRIPGSLEARMDRTRRALRFADRVAHRTGWTGPADELDPELATLLERERRRAEKEFSIRFED